MDKIGRSFQTQSFHSRAQAELKESLARHQQQAEQERRANVREKHIGRPAGIFDQQHSQTNLLMNKTSRLNQRLMKGPGGAAQNMIGSLASITS